MLVYVVRTVHAFRLPPGALHVSYQVSAGHLCVCYEYGLVCAIRFIDVVAITQPPRAVCPSHSSIKHNLGLLQNSRLDPFMVNPQQVKSAAHVVLFSHTLGRERRRV